MTEAVQQLLESFNALTDVEKQSAVAEILRRSPDGSEFTETQLRDALLRMGRDACQATFAAGRPVIVIKGTSLVAFHADGREEVIEPLDPGARLAGEQE